MDRTRGELRMGEYLKLINKKELSKEQVENIISSYFCEHPNIVKELWVSENGDISVKLATCENVFFSFGDIVKLNEFIDDFKEVFEFGEEMSYNWCPKQFLKDRGSLYMDKFSIFSDNKNTPKVRVNKYVKKLRHMDVWKKTERVVSKSGRIYWKRIPKKDCSGCYGNSNGKKFLCPNSDKPFLAYKSGFAWDYKTNKGRELFTCPFCKATFNQGEFVTPQYDWLHKKLLKEDELKCLV